MFVKKSQRKPEAPKTSGTNRTKIKEMETKVGGMTFDEEHPGLALTGQSLAAFQKELVTKARKLAKAKGDLRTMVLRISNSPSSAAYDQSVLELNQWSDKVDRLLFRAVHQRSHQGHPEIHHNFSSSFD